MVIPLKLRELVLALLSESDLTLSDDAVEAIVDKVVTNHSLVIVMILPCIHINSGGSFCRQSWKQILQVMEGLIQKSGRQW